MLVDATKDNQGTRGEHKGEVLKSYEIWVRYREKPDLCEAKARRAKTSARVAREIFDRNLAKMRETDDSLADHTKLAAHRMCQASHSNERRKEKPDPRSRKHLAASVRSKRVGQKQGILGQDVVRKPLKKQSAAKGFPSSESGAEKSSVDTAEFHVTQAEN